MSERDRDSAARLCSPSCLAIIESLTGERELFKKLAREFSEDATRAKKRIEKLERDDGHDWFWTDERLPGLNGRLLVCVHGSVREGYFRDGTFTDAYGEQKPEAWRSLPLAPTREQC